MFTKSFCISQIPHASVNLSLIITHIKDKLTIFCGVWLVQNDVTNNQVLEMVRCRVFDQVTRSWEMDVEPKQISNRNPNQNYYALTNFLFDFESGAGDGTSKGVLRRHALLQHG